MSALAAILKVYRNLRDKSSSNLGEKCHKEPANYVMNVDTKDASQAERVELFEQKNIAI